MQSQKDSHPRLDELVIQLLPQPTGEGVDEVDELVGFSFESGVEGADLEVCCRGGERFEVGYEGGVWEVLAIKF